MSQNQMGVGRDKSFATISVWYKSTVFGLPGYRTYIIEEEAKEDAIRAIEHAAQWGAASVVHSPY
jgi:hypothetical protein